MSTDVEFELSAGEQRLVEIYEQLAEVLREQGDDLPPYARRNAVKALAVLWQVANGAGAAPGQVYDLGA